MITEESLGLIVLFVLFMFAVLGYVFISLPIHRIGKLAKEKSLWRAWVPILQMFMLAKIVKMRTILLTLPFVTLFGGFILFFFVMILSIFSTQLMMIAGLTILSMFVVFGALIWLAVVITIIFWRVFEKLGQPGGLVLLQFVPWVGGLIFLILLNVFAFKANKLKD